jgi:hypothetical protein
VHQLAGAGFGIWTFGDTSGTLYSKSKRIRLGAQLGEMEVSRIFIWQQNNQPASINRQHPKSRGLKRSKFYKENIITLGQDYVSIPTSRVTLQSDGSTRKEFKFLKGAVKHFLFLLCPI